MKAILKLIFDKMGKKKLQKLQEKLNSMFISLIQLLEKTKKALKLGGIFFLIFFGLAIVVYLGMQIQAVAGLFGSFQGKITVNVDKFQTLNQDKELLADSENTNELRETYFQYVSQVSFYQLFNLRDTNDNMNFFENMLLTVEHGLNTPNALTENDIKMSRKTNADGTKLYKSQGILGLFQFDERYIYTDANKNPLKYMKSADIVSVSKNGNLGNNASNMNSYFRDYYNREKTFQISESLLSEMNRVLFGDFKTSETIVYPEAFAKPVYFINDYMRIQLDKTNTNFGKPYVYTTQRVTKEDVNNSSSIYYQKDYLEGLIKEDSSPSKIVYDYAVLNKNIHINSKWNNGTKNSKETVNIGNVSQYASLPNDIVYSDGSKDTANNMVKLYWVTKQGKESQTINMDVTDDNYKQYFTGPYTRLNANGTVDESSLIKENSFVQIDQNGQNNTNPNNSIIVYWDLNKYPRRHLQIPSLTDDLGNVQSSSRMLFNKRYVQHKVVKAEYRASDEYYSKFNDFINADQNKIGPDPSHISKLISKLGDKLSGGKTDVNGCTSNDYKNDEDLPFSQKKCSILKEYTGKNGLGWIKGKVAEIQSAWAHKNPESVKDVEIEITPEGMYHILLTYEDYLIDTGKEGVVWEYQYYSASDLDYEITNSQFKDIWGINELFMGDSAKDDFVRYKEPFDAVQKLNDTATLTSEYSPTAQVSGNTDKTNQNNNNNAWGWKIKSGSNLNDPSKVQLEKVYGEASLQFPTYNVNTINEFINTLFNNYLYGTVTYGKNNFKYVWEKDKLKDTGDDYVKAYYNTLNSSNYKNSNGKTYEKVKKQYDESDIRNKDYAWNPNLKVYRPQETSGGSTSGKLVTNNKQNGKITYQTNPNDTLPLEIKSVRDYGLGSVLSYLEGRRVVFKSGVYMDESYNNNYVKNFTTKSLKYPFEYGESGYYPKELLSIYPEFAKNMKVTDMPIENLNSFANIILSLQRDVTDDEARSVGGWGAVDKIHGLIKSRTSNGYSITSGNGDGTFNISGSGNPEDIGSRVYLNDKSSSVKAFSPYLTNGGNDIIQFCDPIEYYLNWFDYAKGADNIFDKTFRFLSGKGLITSINPSFTDTLNKNKNTNDPLVNGSIHQTTGRIFDNAGTELTGKYKDDFYSKYSGSIDPFKLFDESQSEKIYLIEEAATFLGTFMYTYRDQINDMGTIDSSGSKQIINLAFADRYFYMGNLSIALEKYNYSPRVYKFLYSVLDDGKIIGANSDIDGKNDEDYIDGLCTDFNNKRNNKSVKKAFGYTKDEIYNNINGVSYPNSINNIGKDAPQWRADERKWASKNERIIDKDEDIMCERNNIDYVENKVSKNSTEYAIVVNTAKRNNNIGKNNDYTLSTYQEVQDFLNTSGLSDTIKKKFTINAKVYAPLKNTNSINSIFNDYVKNKKASSFSTAKDLYTSLENVKAYPIKGDIKLDASRNPDDMNMDIIYEKNQQNYMSNLSTKEIFSDAEREQIAKALQKYFIAKKNIPEKTRETVPEHLGKDTGNSTKNYGETVRTTSSISNDRDSLRFGINGVDRANYGYPIPLYRYYAGKLREIMLTQKNAYFDGEELENWENRIKLTTTTRNAKVDYVSRERESKESYFYSYVMNFETYVPLNVKTDANLLSRSRTLNKTASTGDINDKNNANITANYTSNIMSSIENSPAWKELIKKTKQDQNTIIQLISGILEEQIKAIPNKTILMLNSKLKGTNKNATTVLNDANNQAIIKKAFTESISSDSSNTDLSKIRTANLTMSDGTTKSFNLYYIGAGAVMYDMDLLKGNEITLNTANFAKNISVSNKEKFKDVQLKIGKKSDDRTNLQLSIDYVTTVFGKLYQKYGSLPKTILAYYYGENYTNALMKESHAAGEEDTFLNKDNPTLIKKVLIDIAPENKKSELISHQDDIDTNQYTSSVVTIAMTYIKNVNQKISATSSSIKPADLNGNTFGTDATKKEALRVYNNWKKTIDKYSTQYGVDRAILTAIFTQESHGSAFAGLCTSDGGDNENTWQNSTCKKLARSFDNGGGIGQITPGPSDLSQGYITAKGANGTVKLSNLINLSTATSSNMDHIRKTDERFNPIKNIEFATAFFKNAKMASVNDDPLKGLVAYNGFTCVCGDNTVSVKKCGLSKFKKASFGEWYPSYKACKTAHGGAKTDYVAAILRYYNPSISSSSLDLSGFNTNSETGSNSTNLNTGMEIYKKDLYVTQNSGMELYKPYVGADKQSTTTLLMNATSYNAPNDKIPMQADRFNLFDLFSKDKSNKNLDSQNGNITWLGINANITTKGLYSPYEAQRNQKSPLSYIQPLIPFNSVLSDRSYTITTWYGRDTQDNVHSTTHPAIDIARRGNVKIYPAHPGTVTKVVTGCTVENDMSNRCGSGYGNHIEITYIPEIPFQIKASNGVSYTINKITTGYNHLRSVNVAMGDIYSENCNGQSKCHALNDPLGIMGSTGSSTGQHLDFDVKLFATGSDGWSSAKSPTRNCPGCVRVDPVPWFTAGWNGQSGIKVTSPRGSAQTHSP